MKNISFFLSAKFPFLIVKFSIYLNKGVFVMHRSKEYAEYPDNPAILKSAVCL